jgi:oligoribonuclease NrnB/cAMP/cGMP phosphodiesterase (DHH superfamily)
LDELIKYGMEILFENKQYILHHAERAQKDTLYFSNSKILSLLNLNENIKNAFDVENYNVVHLELPSYNLISEISEYLYNVYDIDFVMCYVFQSTDHYKISLRTNKDNINVAEIAETFFNGGGHQKAAGGYLRQNPKNLFNLSYKKKY